MRVILFGILLNLCLCVSGSIIEFNATQYASLPPLYDLDDWSRCRLPGDVYCTVDAVLFSRNSSMLLQLMQDYSDQTLKHYNRTQIHRGVCVTQCGRNDNSKSFRSAAQRCLNQKMQEYGLEVEILSLNGCKLVEEPPASGSSSALGVLCISLVVITFLASVLHVIGDKCAAIEGNKYLLAFSLKRNWSILTYNRSMPRADDRMKNVACMEGIRFLGTQCVIFSHVIFIYVYSYVDNPDFVERMYDQFVWQGVFNSPVWLQAFFALSGFLTAYTILICSESKPYTLLQCMLGIINRYIRLTPVALFALWFTMSWFPLLGDGPQWWWLVEREAQECVERWGYHALYIHNHLPLGKLCMGHTWYLAVDMQLHVLGMVLLLLLLRYRRAVAPVICLLIAGSSLAAGLVVYLNDLTPIITAQSPEAFRTMFKSSVILPLLYLPTWMNLAGYASGIATAFILHHNQLHGVKLNEKKWFNLIYHLSLSLGGCVVLAGTVFLWDETPPRWASALYAALDRTLVSIAFSCFMLGCFSGCKSVLRNALEWRGFHALGRLSYCAYIIHFIVLRLTLAANTQLGHVSILSMISLLITASVLTYIVSIPVCLLVELPFIQLWKALTQRDKRPERPQTPPQPRVKPFDLLAHISIGKRNEV